MSSCSWCKKVVPVKNVGCQRHVKQQNRNANLSTPFLGADTSALSGIGWFLKLFHLVFSALLTLPRIKTFLQLKLLTQYYLWVISASWIMMNFSSFCKMKHHNIVAHILSLLLFVRSSSFFVHFPLILWKTFLRITRYQLNNVIWQWITTQWVEWLWNRRSLAPPTHSLAPHCSLHSRAPLHSFSCSLAH